MLGDQIVDHVVAHVGDDFRRRLVVHPFDALLEDDLALVVHHVVEFQDVLADVEVARFDLLLRLFQRLVDPGMDDRLVLLQPELLQHAVELVGAEDAHQIVFERQEEFGVAGIALAAGTAAQLVVDAPAFVPLGAEHVEAAGGERLFLQRATWARISAARGLFSRSCGSSMSASSWRMRMSALPPSWMSVPRPAMLVAMVMAPGTPACETM